MLYSLAIVNSPIWQNTSYTLCYSITQLQSITTELIHDGQVVIDFLRTKQWTTINIELMISQDHTNTQILEAILYLGWTYLRCLQFLKWSSHLIATCLTFKDECAVSEFYSFRIVGRATAPWLTWIIQSPTTQFYPGSWGWWPDWPVLWSWPAWPTGKFIASLPPWEGHQPSLSSDGQKDGSLLSYLICPALVHLPVCLLDLWGSKSATPTLQP